MNEGPPSSMVIVADYNFQSSFLDDLQSKGGGWLLHKTRRGACPPSPFWWLLSPSPLSSLCCHSQLLLSKVAPDLQTSEMGLRGEDREREREEGQDRRGDQCIKGRASKAEPFPCLLSGLNLLMTEILQFIDLHNKQ